MSVTVTRSRTRTAMLVSHHPRFHAEETRTRDPNSALPTRPLCCHSGSVADHAPATPEGLRGGPSAFWSCWSPWVDQAAGRADWVPPNDGSPRPVLPTLQGQVVRRVLNASPYSPKAFWGGGTRLDTCSCRNTSPDSPEGTAGTGYREKVTAAQTGPPESRTGSTEAERRGGRN